MGPYSGLRNNCGKLGHKESVRISVETTPCSYRLPTVGSNRVFIYGVIHGLGFHIWGYSPIGSSYVGLYTNWNFIYEAIHELGFPIRGYSPIGVSLGFHTSSYSRSVGEGGRHIIGEEELIFFALDVDQAVEAFLPTPIQIRLLPCTPIQTRLRPCTPIQMRRWTST